MVLYTDDTTEDTLIFGCSGLLFIFLESRSVHLFSAFFFHFEFFESKSVPSSMCLFGDFNVPNKNCVHNCDYLL